MYFFQKLSQYSLANNVLEAPASNVDGSFGKIHVFLELICIGLFGDN
jgi:hypothetical protein